MTSIPTFPREETLDQSDTRAPQVSILLPVHDSAATLPACLRSIRRQREQRWECVAVDDGSRDGSLEILREVARLDPRFRVISRPHRGLVATLNTGLDHCRGAAVARMDADDWMHRDRLAAQLGLLASRPALSAVGCRVRLFPRADLRDGRRAYERWINDVANAPTIRSEAFVECPIAHPALMIRREVLVEHRYREMGWPEDYDLLLRLLQAGCEMAVHPRRLLGWRDSPGRLSRTAPEYALERFTACKAAHLAAGFLAGHERYLLWGYGETGRTLRRALLPYGKSPSHIIELHPGRLGQQIHGAPVVPPDALRGLPRIPLLTSVAGAEPREKIRAALGHLGFIELRDFVCTA